VNGTVATPMQLRAPTTTPTGKFVPSWREAAASFWLDALFRAAGSPLVTRSFRPIVLGAAPKLSRSIQRSTAANAQRIFGPDLTRARQAQYTRGVVGSFYDFVCDIGQSLHLSREQLIARIESVQGKEHYTAARAMDKGVIIATAHMGSFEAGAAALLEREETGRMHVVFKRDATRFEKVRSSLRQRMGVSEAAVDEGWVVWLRLREALQRGDVVMLQADRVMPGQKGATIPFLHGHLTLPTSPIKLSLASGGAPIVPIFALRLSDGRICIHIEPAITVEASDADPNPALLAFASVLEKYVAAHPEQWLLLHPAFTEDGA
jgi:KDO2-lipid IV(A) lauroyltransferase